MTSLFSVTYIDYANKPSTVSVRGIDLTGANFDAQNTLMDTLKSAMDDVVIANEITDKRTASVTQTAKVLPANPDAQRGQKWSVSGTDTVTGAAAGFEIPGADQDQLTGNTNVLDLTAGNGLALKNAIEAFAVSVAGNPIAVSSITLVSRTN